MLCSNLLSPKVTDGVSRMLSKSDMEGMKKLKNISEVEKMLKSAWSKMNEAIDAGSLSQDQGFAAFGKFCVRVALLCLKKEKGGMEGKSYGTLEAIQKVLEHDLSHPHVSGLLAIGNDSQPSSASEVVSMSDTSSPAWIASQKGFAVGKLFVHNHAHPAPGDEYDKMICSITAMTDEHVHLIEVSPFSSKPKELLCPYSELDSLTKFTGKVSLALGPEFSDRYPEQVEWFTREASKAALFSQMAKGCVENSSVCQGLKFIINPYLLVATKAFKKGELRLPLGTDQISKIQGQPSNGSVEVALSDHEVWYVGPPNMPKSETHEAMPKSALIIPFWWVPVAEQGEDFNMEYKASALELVNTKGIKVGDRLRQNGTKLPVQSTSESKKRKKL